MTVTELVARARQALRVTAEWDQAQVNQSVKAVAWAIYKPENARLLAELAVRDTGIGNVEDKIAKNQRKTLGTLRDLLRSDTVGCIEDSPSTGLRVYGKPVGVVGAVTPSTNPAATPANNAMMALKGANAIILSASPSGWTTVNAFVELARGELAAIGAPVDLIQRLPQPVSISATEELMREVDLVVATGAQHNVRSAYSSGTPAIGVGVGNVPVIIDSSADLPDAAAKIAKSKTFDNSSSCSAENSLIILDDVYEDMHRELAIVGGYRCGPDQVATVRNALFPGGEIERSLIAQPFSTMSAKFGLQVQEGAGRFIVVEPTEPDRSDPLTGEKLSLVLCAYRAADFQHATELAKAVLDYQGAGHSVGIHTKNSAQAQKLAAELPVARVLVNQAHAIGTGGSFDNGMPFSLSMGCGTWQGNSISENLNVEHFINKTRLVETIPVDQPPDSELFGGLPAWEVAANDN